MNGVCVLFAVITKQTSATFDVDSSYYEMFVLTYSSHTWYDVTWSVHKSPSLDVTFSVVSVFSSRLSFIFVVGLFSLISKFLIRSRMPLLILLRENSKISLSGDANKTGELFPLFLSLFLPLFLPCRLQMSRGMKKNSKELCCHCLCFYSSWKTVSGLTSFVISYSDSRSQTSLIDASCPADSKPFISLFVSKLCLVSTAQSEVSANVLLKTLRKRNWR